jgi:hypothetical protein
MEIIAEAKSIEQFFISRNRENVEILNIALRISTELQITEWSKLGGRLGTKETAIPTSRVENSPLA